MMALLFGRRGPEFRAIRVFLSFLGVAALPSVASAADINVVLDEARLVKLPDRVGTLVIGNPLIADASVLAGGLMVITGKGYGLTNVIALDRTGAVLLEKSVEVRGPRTDVIVVYRGVERETYSCAPDCERRVTLGDSKDYFETLIGQVGARNGQAQGIAPPPK